MCRTEKPIDWKNVDDLLMAGCTGVQIAPHFDMHVNTFYRKVEEKYSMSFVEYCSYKRSQGESLIQAKQFKKAVVKEDTQMLLWLGKTRLGQVEAKRVDDLPPEDGQLDLKLELIKALGKIKELEDKINAPQSQTDTIVQRSESQI